MKASRIISSIFLIALGIAIGWGYSQWHAAHPMEEALGTEATGYHCPMHPNFRSDRPGSCGICGMDLVPDAKPDTPAPTERTVLYYQDPADPSFQSHDPGVNPATGNALEPVYSDGAGDMPMGTIRISPEKQQLIGVRFDTVQVTSGTQSFRTVGKVEPDERRIAKIQTRIDGWIEEVFVDFTGKLVQQGDPLITLYSPEMLASQREYLLALRSRDILKGSPLEGTQQNSESLVEAARRRLQLWELSDAQIDQIARTQQPLTQITLYSPITGFVTERNAFPNQRITPETELYTVVDLSAVWIMADVFENEASSIQEGMPVTVSLPYQDQRKLAGRVDYIQPSVDPTTRTLKIRVEADNPGFVLKPEMFVDVQFRIAHTSQLTVPSEAILDSGLRKTVFVDRGNGYLEPRQVETGERIGDRTQVLRGLKEGERVAVSGNFLIDSESQLKAAASGMAGHQHGSGTETDPSPTPTPNSNQPDHGNHDPEKPGN